MSEPITDIHNARGLFPATANMAYVNTAAATAFIAPERHVEAPAMRRSTTRRPCDDLGSIGSANRFVASRGTPWSGALRLLAAAPNARAVSESEPWIEVRRTSGTVCGMTASSIRRRSSEHQTLIRQEST